MSSALLDETRSERLDLGLVVMKQLRLSPTLAEVLGEEKPATQTWGDFALAAMVEKVVTARSLRGDYRGVIRLLVRLVGQPSDGAAGGPAQRPTPDSRPVGPTNGRGALR
jgi:hypothetical protein